MKIKKFVFNPFQVNCYLVYDETGECIIVDASCYGTKEVDKLIGFIAQNNLKPVMLINTHGHVDHLPMNAFFMEKYSIPLAMHKNDLFLLDSAVEHGLFFGFEIEQPPNPTIFLKDKEFISFGETRLEVRHAPGHSPGSIVLYSLEGEYVITGDVLFSQSIGRTDLPGGDHKILLKSIRSQLLTLPDETTVYPGHGSSTTIGSERVNNPFLK